MIKLKLLYPFLSIIFIGCLLQMSCTSDQLDEPMINENCVNLDATYDGAIKPIIDATCAIAGCHVSGGGAPGNFTSYERMGPYLNDDEIKLTVVILRNDPENGMPPNWDTNPGPKDLTDEQFELMECWIDAGYPEN